MKWPWPRFEAFYVDFLRREAVEALERRHSAIVTGLWANDGLNDDKGTREQSLADLDKQFQDAAEVVYSGNSKVPDENEITKEDEENPFLAPAIKATREIEAPAPPEDDFMSSEKSDGSDLSNDQA